MHSIKTPWLIVILVVLIILAGALLKLSNRSVVLMQQRQMPTPSGAMGVNGSPNQGNMGQPDSSGGIPQQPDMQAQGSAAAQITTPPAQQN